MEATLFPYRVLDLTGGGCLMAGRLLADLGATVIKVEKVGGDPSRNTGPFYHDIPDPGKSLFWYACNRGKKSISLNLESKDGGSIFLRLVEKSDIVLESFPPNYLKSIGLGYDRLAEINPSVIVTSITPFGQSGPYAEYRGSDLTLSAMGGIAYITGYPGEEPLRITSPQAETVAGCQAAAATVIARYHRSLTGQGQQVDVSIQACVAWTITNAVPFWELSHSNLKRRGSALFGKAGGVKQKLIWKCRDGFVTYTLMGGKFGAKDNLALVAWMGEEGLADDYIRDFDWPEYDIGTSTQDLQDRLESYLGRFFATHTKVELYEGGFRRGIKVYPINTPGDVCGNTQLKERDFWLKINHPELDETLTYPGYFFKSSEAAGAPGKRPPEVGEHNAEIYGEIGISAEDMTALKQAGVI